MGEKGLSSRRVTGWRTVALALKSGEQIPYRERGGRVRLYSIEGFYRHHEMPTGTLGVFFTETGWSGNMTWNTATPNPPYDYEKFRR